MAPTNLIQYSFELAAERCEDLTPLVYRRLFHSHDAYGTPRELFGKFFGVIADTMRDLLGADWSPEIADAWRKLLMELDRFVREGETAA